jgi:hypothetical protein
MDMNPQPLEAKVSGRLPAEGKGKTRISRRTRCPWRTDALYAFLMLTRGINLWWVFVTARTWNAYQFSEMPRMFSVIRFGRDRERPTCRQSQRRWHVVLSRRAADLSDHIDPGFTQVGQIYRLTQPHLDCLQNKQKPEKVSHLASRGLRFR